MSVVIKRVLHNMCLIKLTATGALVPKWPLVFVVLFVLAANNGLFIIL